MNPHPDPTFRAIRAHIERLGYAWPLKLSCNGNRECWVPESAGLTDRRTRVHIQDEVILGLADLVLQAQPQGGRFVLADSGLYLMSTDSWVEWDEWVARLPQENMASASDRPILDEGRGTTAPPRGKKRRRTPKRKTYEDWFPRRVATPEVIREKFPDAKFHRRLGNIHNPRRGPLSQGGDS